MSDDTAERIRSLRKQRQLSQVDLARLSHLSGSFVSLIESGRRPATDRTLQLIADALGCTADYLATGRGTPHGQQDQLDTALAFAEVALRAGEPVAARERFEAALDEAGTSGTPRQVWRAQWGLARSLEFSGELEAAITAYEAALRADISQSDRFAVNTALCRAYLESGDIEHAVGVGEQALTQAEDADGTLISDEAVELASTLVGCFQERGDLTKAHLLAQRVIADADQARSPRARGAAYWNAALVEEARGDLQTARRYLDRAAALYGEGDNARGVALLRLAQGWLVLQEHGSTDRAKALLGHAHAELSQIGTPVDIAYAETELARCALLEGDPDGAQQLANRSLERLGTSARLEASRALLVLAQALMALSEWEQAKATLEQSWSALRQIDKSRHAAIVWRELGEAYLQLGQVETAAELFRQALEVSGVSLRTPTTTVRRSSVAGRP